MESPAEKLTTRNQTSEDSGEGSIRPQSLNDFTGQKQAIENLKVFISAAKKRGKPLDHILFHGPPGLGKTTLAQIISREMGVNFRSTSGPVLTKAGDLAAILTSLQEGDVMFIDEIHRLQATVEEMLYPAMEDYKLDIIIGEGVSARTIRIDLPHFTLIGATTRLGLISNPLRDRFGIPIRLNFYEVPELQKVIERGAKIVGTGITKDGAMEIARRSRGTPRIAIRLLKRVADFASFENAKTIEAKLADKALRQLEVDEMGLDAGDRRYMKYIADNYAGGPVGLETIAAGLSEQRDVIEETIEPYLLQIGFVGRTPRGRVLTAQAFRHIGLEAPKPLLEQIALIDSAE